VIVFWFEPNILINPSIATVPVYGMPWVLMLAYNHEMLGRMLGFWEVLAAFFVGAVATLIFATPIMMTLQLLKLK